MCGKSPFFLQSPFAAEKLIADLRSCSSDSNVLLFAFDCALSGPSQDFSSISGLDFVVDFCLDVFDKTKAVCDSVSQTLTNMGFAGAWYDRENPDILLAAERVRDRVTKSSAAVSFYSVAVSEIDAYRQITSAEDCELVVDPLLLPEGDGEFNMSQEASRMIAKHLPLRLSKEIEIVTSW